MAEKKTTRTAASRSTNGKTNTGFTADERAAMKERARELKAEARVNKDRALGESAVLAAIAEMPQPDRGLAERIHGLIQDTAPELAPKTWYGMPAYARAGKVVCFFKPAAKFQSRYATIGFEEAAHLDDGVMWVTSFALTAITAAEEAKIRALVKKAAG